MQYENGRVEWHEVHQFNTFDREEMKYFVGTVYDGYRLGLHPEAFDYVTGFFSDEVGFLYGHGVSIKNGGVPWCEEVGSDMKSSITRTLWKNWNSFLWRRRDTISSGIVTGRFLLIFWQNHFTRIVTTGVSGTGNGIRLI